MAGSDTTNTMDVQEKHQFPVAALQGYMEEHVAGFTGQLQVSEFIYGQSNPTYLLEAGGTHYVMRRKPPGELLKSAHAIDREYRVITALQNTEVPVPNTYALCTDENVIGTWFYIMEYLEGRVVEDSVAGPYTPKDRGESWNAANDAVAQLHNVDFEAQGLSDYGKHTDYIARQVSRWGGQYEYTGTVENPYMDNLIEYLGNNIPQDDSCSIVHGDLQIANMMMYSDRNEVMAILDWELSTLGNPLADFAYLCRPYREGLRDLDLKALGIPSEQEYVERYCESTGRDGINDWEFYLAFNIFKMSAILQGIAKRELDGTAANREAGEAGTHAFEMSKLAWSLIDKSVKLD